MARTLTYIVPAHMHGETMQTFLRREIGMSSRTVVKLKRVTNGMMLDGVRVRTIDIVSCGQTVSVTLPEDDVHIEPCDMPLEVAFEDDDILVVNKPPFLAVHPSAGKTDPTLANIVVGYYEKQGKSLSFRPLSRLDRNTSGLLPSAKNRHTAFAMRTAFQKRYLAIVCGELHGEGTIDQPIRVKEGCTITREVGEGGKDSITHWRALATDGDITLCDVVIETGRTHQIRVHMSWLGHPLVGDTMYGEDESLPRHALHCYTLDFVHPVTGEAHRLKASVPEDMNGYLEKHGLQEAIICLQ